MKQIQRVIVIDDDETVVFISGLVIKKYKPNLEYLSFSQANEALEYIKKEYTVSPVNSALLLDINMPNRTGWDILADWENLDKEIRDYFSVFMFSSSIYHEDIALAKANSAVTDFIEKPLTVEKLNSMIAKIDMMSQIRM